MPAFRWTAFALGSVEATELAHELTHVVQQQGAFSYNVEDEELPYETGLPGGMLWSARVPTARLQRVATWAPGARDAAGQQRQSRDKDSHETPTAIPEQSA